MKDLILEMSRQNQMDSLSPWFDAKLDEYINIETYADIPHLEKLKNATIDKLVQYREQAGVSTAVLGVSGGVDSALTAALLKAAGWRVIGVVMPIHQNPEETRLGMDACEALDLQCQFIDLSNEYDNMIEKQVTIDSHILGDSKEAKIRRGNIRARLRMITLYNLASANHGLVASTDNFSELAAGFWTLHGDCGDLSPIQSYTKSWEVPMIAKLVGVPESIWRAKPTDGLGVDDGDEAQFGFSYLELDLALLATLESIHDGLLYDVLNANGKWNVAGMAEHLDLHSDEHALHVYKMLMTRIESTWFKRLNPVNIKHALEPWRYKRLEELDFDFFHPAVVKK